MQRMSKSFGQVLRDLREKRGLSSRKLAMMTGLSAPYMHDIEHDRRGALSQANITRASAVMQLTDVEDIALRVAALRTKGSIEIDSDNDAVLQLAVTFSQRCDGLNDKQIARIRRVLREVR